jgi:hypothetical protein
VSKAHQLKNRLQMKVMIWPISGYAAYGRPVVMQIPSHICRHTWCPYGGFVTTTWKVWAGGGGSPSGYGGVKSEAKPPRRQPVARPDGGEGDGPALDQGHGGTACRASYLALALRFTPASMRFCCFSLSRSLFILSTRR